MNLEGWPFKFNRGKRYRLKKLYGMSETDFNDMFYSQGGTCKLCKSLGDIMIDGWLVVDHCHKTGKPRGLLCPTCNSGLGHFKDNILTIKNAINYLKENTDERI